MVYVENSYFVWNDPAPLRSARMKYKTWRCWERWQALVGNEEETDNLCQRKGGEDEVDLQSPRANCAMLIYAVQTNIEELFGPKRQSTVTSSAANIPADESGSPSVHNAKFTTYSDDAVQSPFHHDRAISGDTPVRGFVPPPCLDDVISSENAADGAFTIARHSQTNQRCGITIFIYMFFFLKK